MAYTNYGTAGVPHTYGTISWSGLAATCELLITSLEITHDYAIKQDLINPTDGEIIGNASGRLMYTCRVSALAVSKTTHSVANAAAALIAPAARSKVTIASDRNTDANADWIYEGGFTASETSDGFATISMNLVRYPNSSKTAEQLTTSI
jgi:hypothetical protein